jgi:hypothetical protein
MSEHVRCPRACLILDLITGHTILSKRGIFYLDSKDLPIENVEIQFGVVLVLNCNDRTQFTIVASPFPALSPAAPQEVLVSVEVDQIPFFPSPLLHHSTSEEVARNALSRTPSPQVVSKKNKKGRKKLKN